MYYQNTPITLSLLFLILGGAHCTTKAFGDAKIAQEAPPVSLRENVLTIERPASPMACPDQYCSLIKNTALRATHGYQSPLHLDFGESLVPVLKEAAARKCNIQSPLQLWKAIHHELIVTLWERRLAKLVLDLLNERDISGLSITGFTTNDYKIFTPMIQRLIEANHNIQKLGLNYKVSIM